MTSRPSASITSGPWAEASTRSSFHRPASLILASSAWIWGFIESNMSAFLPPRHEHHLACLSGTEQRDRLVELLHRHDVGDRRTDVEPTRGEQVVHLVPGLVHAPPDDPMERDPLEDHQAIPIERKRLLEQAQERE